MVDWRFVYLDDCFMFDNSIFVNYCDVGVNVEVFVWFCSFENILNKVEIIN